MDLNWLLDFTCFARTMNFTKAAEERNITQSAFSRRIKALELWLGVELIDRTSFPANLSNAGREFLPQAKLITHDLLKARAELQLGEAADEDTARFAAPHSVSIYNLMPLLTRLEKTTPNVKTRVISDNLYNCCDQLAEQNCDFLVCYRHRHVPITLDEQRFVRLDIGKDRLLPVYAPKTANKVNKWDFSGNNTSDIPYLRFSRGSYLGAITERIINTAPVNFKTRHTDAFAEALKRLCLQGAGVAWLPEASVFNELKNKQLVIAGGDEWQEALTLSIYAEPSILSKHREEIWQFFRSMSAE